VQKVIQLLQGMLEKGKKEKKEEQVQFASFKQFCDDTTVEKDRAIKENEERIELAKAEAAKESANIQKLTKEIAIEEQDISIWAGDKKAATTVRDLEKDEFRARARDLQESVNAVTRGIDMLKKNEVNAEQAAAFIQVNVKDFPAEATALLDAPVEAPQDAAYTSHMDYIIEMLEKLAEKFSGELSKAQRSESQQQHAYDMLMQELEAEMGQAEEDKTQKQSSKTKSMQNKADALAERDDAVILRDSDKKYVSDLTATCQEKTSDFKARQQLRSEEIEAVEKAIEIMQNGVAGNAQKHLPALLQTKSTALVQVETEEGMARATQVRVAAFLQRQAQQLNSKILLALASKVSADPFTKVKKMIQDLVTKLMEEAAEEGEQKEWCDKELSSNEQTRKEKTDAVEMLWAESDALTASIAKLGEDMTTLREEIVELETAMSKETNLRTAEKAKNAETIADAKSSQEAVAQALTVLKDFYAKAGEATAFVQGKSTQPIPEFAENEYKGMQSENGGVVGMMEVIESDFARLEADTTAAEETAQKEYDTFMDDSKTAKATKESEIEKKQIKQEDQKRNLSVNKEDLRGTQKELASALKSFDELKKTCIDTGMNYEDRVAQRKAEIESLQEALKILKGEA